MSEEEGPHGKLRNRWEDVQKDAGKLLHKNNKRGAEGHWHDWKKKTGHARSRKTSQKAIGRRTENYMDNFRYVISWDREAQTC